MAEIAAKSQTFALGGSEQGQHGAVYALRDRKRNAFDPHVPGFNLGKVQDVVEHRHEAFGRTLQYLNITPPLVFVRFLQNEVREAENAVHRRADFVAHVGQKCGFRAVGSVGLLGGSLQFGQCGAQTVLRVLLLRNVPPDRQDPNSLRSLDLGIAQLDATFPSVAEGDGVLGHAGEHAFLEATQVARANARLSFIGVDDPERLVFQSILGQTGKPAVGFVHPGYDPVPIGEAHGIVRVVPDEPLV